VRKARGCPALASLLRAENGPSFLVSDVALRDSLFFRTHTTPRHTRNGTKMMPRSAEEKARKARKRGCDPNARNDLLLYSGLLKHENKTFFWQFFGRTLVQL
jgi:hypothetical protein